MGEQSVSNLVTGCLVVGSLGHFHRSKLHIPNISQSLTTILAMGGVPDLGSFQMTIKGIKKIAPPISLMLHMLHFTALVSCFLIWAKNISLASKNHGAWNQEVLPGGKLQGHNFCRVRASQIGKWKFRNLKFWVAKEKKNLSHQVIGQKRQWLIGFQFCVNLPTYHLNQSVF